MWPLVLLAAMIPAVAWALPGTPFEGNDGNLAADAGTDWQTLVGSPGLVVGHDEPSGQTDDSLRGKEDDVVPGVDFGSIPTVSARWAVTHRLSPVTTLMRTRSRSRSSHPVSRLAPLRALRPSAFQVAGTTRIRFPADSGVRDFEAVNALAAAAGLELRADHAMPSNNQLIVWKGA